MAPGIITNLCMLLLGSQQRDGSQQRGAVMCRMDTDLTGVNLENVFLTLVAYRVSEVLSRNTVPVIFPTNISVLFS